MSKKMTAKMTRDASGALRFRVTEPRPNQQIQVETAGGVSWRRGGNGTRTLRVRSVRRDDRHFIDLSIEEIAHPDEAPYGRYVTRQTFFCADGPNAEAVVEAVAPGYDALLKAARRAIAALAANGAPNCEAAKELRAAITAAWGK